MGFILKLQFTDHGGNYQHGFPPLASFKVFMSQDSTLDKSSPQYLCQRCGNCCRWPGDVRITEAEFDPIARFLGLSVESFIERYTRLNANRTGLSIIDKANGECVFLHGKNICLIQPVKPIQCGGFPNDWNFPGWRDLCEAIEVDPSDLAKPADNGKDTCNTVQLKAAVTTEASTF